MVEEERGCLVVMQGDRLELLADCCLREYQVARVKLEAFLCRGGSSKVLGHNKANGGKNVG
jgi:hypothetical protein